MINLFASRRARVALAGILQLGILVVAVAGPLSARLTGREYLLRVSLVDPVDPFRGAYVALSYPDLAPTAPGNPGDAVEPRPAGTVYLPLVADGDAWKGTGLVRTAPSGPYLRCQDDGWLLRCGIESWFLPQGKAAAAERALTDGKAVAVVRIDGHGNAALVGLRPSG